MGGDRVLMGGGMGVEGGEEGGRGGVHGVGGGGVGGEDVGGADIWILGCLVGSTGRSLVVVMAFVEVVVVVCLVMVSFTILNFQLEFNR